MSRESRGYMTTREAAEELGVSDTQVGRLCERGVLRRRRSGRCWMVSADDVRIHKEKAGDKARGAGR